MSLEVNNMDIQLVGILISLVAGILLAAVYDTMKIVRLLLSGEKSHVVVQDFFFMILAAFVTYLVSLAVSYGVVRFYVIACEIIGVCIYFLTLGMVTERLAKWIHKIFCGIFRFFRRFFFHPLFVFFRAIGRWVWSKCGFLKKITKKLQNLLKPKGNMVYNHFIGLRRKKERERQRRGRNDAGMKVINGKPKRRKRSIILRIALLAFAVYIVASIVNQQIQIGQKKQELSMVSQQLNAQNLKNEELKTALETGTTDSDEFIERKAREELNYVKPNERVFVNIAGD